MMTDYIYGNWYCKAANEAEAKEIVLRAIASGAVSTRAWGFNSSNYGVNSGNVTAIVSPNAVKYTIAELRQKFPLPGEQEKEVKSEKIDADRLKVDREYWDSVAPDGAEMYYPEDKHNYEAWGKVCEGIHYVICLGAGIKKWKKKEVFTCANYLIRRPEEAEEHKQWRGPEDGLPPVGTECIVTSRGRTPHEVWAKFCDKTVEIVAHTVDLDGIGLAVFQCIDEDGDLYFHGLIAECFAPLEQKDKEREKWAEDALSLDCDPHQGILSRTDFVNAIYDAMQSGKLTLPEVKE